MTGDTAVDSVGAGDSALAGIAGDAETDGVMAPEPESAAFFCCRFLASYPPTHEKLEPFPLPN